MQGFFGVRLEETRRALKVRVLFGREYCHLPGSGNVACKKGNNKLSNPHVILCENY